MRSSSGHNRMGQDSSAPLYKFRLPDNGCASVELTSSTTQRSLVRSFWFIQFVAYPTHVPAEDRTDPPLPPVVVLILHDHVLVSRSNGNGENTLTPLPAPQVQCTPSIPLHAPYEVMAMYSKDSKLVGIGVVLIILTFLLCQESPTSPPSRSTSPVTTPAEPSVPSAAVLKKKIDEVLTGRTITFPTSSAVLLPEGRSTLGQILPILQQNQTVTFEIGGHTDNVGVEEKNRALSENRAKSVMDYLVSKGVAANRLTFKGYGASRPLADNATDEGRSRNRRIEFLVRVKGAQP